MSKFNLNQMEKFSKPYVFDNIISSIRSPLMFPNILITSIKHLPYLSFGRAWTYEASGSSPQLLSDEILGISWRFSYQIRSCFHRPPWWGPQTIFNRPKRHMIGKIKKSGAEIRKSIYYNRWDCIRMWPAPYSSGIHSHRRKDFRM